MGRGKIEIKRIENRSNRQVTYSKRRTGILKKAKEITVLCDAKVSVVIFGSNGKMNNYCSRNTNLVQHLDTYQKLSHKRLWDDKHENLSNEIDRINKENDSMQIELRHLRGEDIASLHFQELISLEDALETGLNKIRDQKTEEFNRMAKNEQMLEEENEQLSYILHQQEMAAAAAVAMTGNVRDYEAQMPFAFRVQPNQPNLHQRM